MKFKLGDLIKSNYTKYSCCVVLSVHRNEISSMCYLLEKSRIVQELIGDYEHEWTKLNET